MNVQFKKEISGVCQNLKNGLRLLIFKRVFLNEFYVSLDQLLILALLLAGVTFIGSLILSLPNPEFSQYGIATLTIQFSFFALGSYLYSKIYDVKEKILSLFIVLLSIWPIFHLVWLVVGKSATFNFWDIYGENKYFYIILNIWIAAVVVTAFYRNFSKSRRHIFFTFLIYISVIGFPLNYLGFSTFWHHEYNYKPEKKSLNQEATYYKQFKFMENLRTSLLPQRRGISDIYFVGFASYAREDVFMNEVQYAKGLLDEKYDTKGRSITLINNKKTLDNIPLASKSNLNLVLDHIGKIIDLNDDVLFLYLTSHGSIKHKLSVNMWPLELNELDPSDLKTALDNSGIKYRILLVSACYSGGFIEPLKDEYTLIFTAAAKNKTSFGCNNKNKFTYFGRAVFKDNMEHNYNLISAFNGAIESISKKEKAEKLTPSEPQLFIGNKIKEKLSIITREIEEYNRKKKF